jgi:hypothetical protein
MNFTNLKNRASLIIIMNAKNGDYDISAPEMPTQSQSFLSHIVEKSMYAQKGIIDRKIADGIWREVSLSHGRTEEQVKEEIFTWYIKKLSTDDYRDFQQQGRIDLIPKLSMLHYLTSCLSTTDIKEIYQMGNCPLTNQILLYAGGWNNVFVYGGLAKELKDSIAANDAYGVNKLFNMIVMGTQGQKHYRSREDWIQQKLKELKR